MARWVCMHGVNDDLSRHKCCSDACQCANHGTGRFCVDLSVDRSTSVSSSSPLPPLLPVPGSSSHEALSSCSESISMDASRLSNKAELGFEICLPNRNSLVRSFNRSSLWSSTSKKCPASISRLQHERLVSLRGQSTHLRYALMVGHAARNLDRSPKMQRMLPLIPISYTLMLLASRWSRLRSIRVRR